MGSEEISPGIEVDSDQVDPVLCDLMSDGVGGSLSKSKDTLKS